MILFDGHVHMYDCYNLDRFFTAACKNFSQVARKTPDPAELHCFLLLAESAGFDSFNDLQSQAGSPSHSAPWSIEHHEANVSFTVRHRTYPDINLTVVAGRQLVTAERLELLALMSDAVFPDGMPLPEAVRQVAEAGAIPVCPWGAGKWLGSRGRILTDFISHDSKYPFFLGDSGGRPWMWPRPSLFEKATYGGTIISGSDPLPLSGEEERVASFGSWVDESCDPKRPAASLREMLLAGNSRISPFGNPMGPVSFIKKQIGLRRGGN